MGSGCSTQSSAAVQQQQAVASTTSLQSRESGPRDGSSVIDHTIDTSTAHAAAGSTTTTLSFVDNSNNNNNNSNNNNRNALSSSTSSRLLQFLVHGNHNSNSSNNNNNNRNNNTVVLDDLHDSDDDSDSTDDSLSQYYNNNRNRRRGLRGHGRERDDPFVSPTPRNDDNGRRGRRRRRPLRGFRRRRRRRQEEDLRLAEVMALQQSLAAMEDFFQSLLNHSNLLLEVMDPSVETNSMAATTSGPPPASQSVLQCLPRRKWSEIVSRQQQQQQNDQGINNKCCEESAIVLTNSTDSAEPEQQLDCIECGVCFEAHQDDELVIELPCGHIYHVECVEDWLQRHCTCPSCRYELPTDDIIYERGRKERMKHRSIPTTAATTTTTTTIPTPSLQVPRSSIRMRSVMSESPSSWFIDHLQGSPDDDDDDLIDDYYYYGRRHAHLSNTNNTARQQQPPLQDVSTLPTIAEHYDDTVESMQEREEDHPNGQSLGEQEAESTTTPITNVDVVIVPGTDIAHPAVVHYPQQDTCAGIGDDDDEDLVSSMFTGINHTVGTAATIAGRHVNVDSDDDDDDSVKFVPYVVPVVGQHSW